MISLARLFSLMKREAVLSAAAALALLSMLWVPPDGAYLSYVDWRTMAQLFCLMAVMAGLRELGVFSRLGRQLLCRVRSARQLECVLVFLCFFTSMAITNDVALLTFVPFSLEVLTLAGREERAVPVVVFQTVAANLGSMATPIGNPQNLYLYAQSHMSLTRFLLLMLPYTLLSLFLITVLLLLHKKEPITVTLPSSSSSSTGGFPSFDLSSFTSSRSRFAYTRAAFATCSFWYFFLFALALMCVPSMDTMLLSTIRLFSALFRICSKISAASSSGNLRQNA